MKRRFSKLLSCVLAGTMMVSMSSVLEVTAAEKDSNDPLVMVYPADPGAEEKLNTILEDFNKEYPDIQVDVEYIPFTNWGDYITKVKTMIAGNQSIDVIRLATEGVSTFVEEGLAIPFNDFFEKMNSY